MKTTLDLPDDLLIAAKKLAAERRTTLKDMVTRSLRREIEFETQPLPKDDDIFEIGPTGLLRLKTRGVLVTDEIVRQLRDEEGD